MPSPFMDDYGVTDFQKWDMRIWAEEARKTDTYSNEELLRQAETEYDEF